jgi:hypothetical protein
VILDLPARKIDHAHHNDAGDAKQKNLPAEAKTEAARQPKSAQHSQPQKYQIPKIDPIYLKLLKN